MKPTRLLPLIALVALAPANVAAQDPFRVPIGDQIKLGKRVGDEIRKKQEVAPDRDPRVRLMRTVGARLLRQIPAEERKNRPFEYTFDLIVDKSVNAFALPGGPIFFYTGLFERFETEDQLAGVLAHEITHIRNQHWASAYADRQKRQLGLALLLTLVNANATLVNIVDIADSVVIELPYSRRHETEADMVGYDMMTAAGYNPQGLVEVFEMFQKLAAGGKPPEFLSTHPDDRARIQRLKDRAAKDRRTFPAPRKLKY